MAVNKVVFNTAEGEQTLIDLTKDTATVDTVFQGATFHGADGEVKTGTFTISEELSTQDALIQQIESALAGKAAGGSGLPTQEKAVEITENGSHEILPDAGYTLSKVTAMVSVPIPDGYIQPSGTLEVTENGTHDVAEYASVNVNVAASGGGSGEEDVAALLGNTMTELNNSIVTSLRSRACQSATALVTVNLPLVTTVGAYAFYGCSSLVTVTLPKLISLASQTFYSCNKLQRADCGQLRNIPAQAFNGCPALTELILRKTGSICTLGNVNGVNNTAIGKGTGYVYVPASLVDSYKAANNWSTFAAQIRAIEDYPDICGGAE